MAPGLKGRRILVTGGAGFIGSHLVDALVASNEVTVLDDLSTGARDRVSSRARLIVGDIRDPEVVRDAVEGVDTIFHEAALPSVARSFEDPVTSQAVNATGTLLLLETARKAGVGRFVYAASSSAYGETPILPKREDMTPAPLSPYAVGKLSGEQFVRVFARTYGIKAFSLRYFNVYGPRQDPASVYAAVVPRFITAALEGRPLTLFGDGTQSRDFTYVGDAVAANLLAAARDGAGEVVNIAGGRRTTLLELVDHLQALVARPLKVQHAPPRPGDILHSHADLALADRLLGYVPRVPIEEGLRLTLETHGRRTTPPAA